PADTTGAATVTGLRPEAALVEYLESHGLGRLSRRLARSGVVEVAATAAPGIKDILVLGKVKQLERAGAADLIVVDGPASGHAVSFLTSASGLLGAVRSGPLRDQAEEVQDMLTDPDRCQVLLVTLAEETPVNEVAETAFMLEDRAGVTLAPVVVNRLDPTVEGLDADPATEAEGRGLVLPPGEAEALAAAARFRAERQELQDGQVRRLGEVLPLAQLHLPALPAVDIGPAQVDRLARALASAVRELPQGPRAATR
ncbi:MAG: hypothetical protein ACRD0Q_05330, partial [Acidimicrobiales bacterium]